jgi:hypothetical protein
VWTFFPFATGDVANCDKTWVANCDKTWVAELVCEFAKQLIGAKNG